MTAIPPNMTPSQLVRLAVVAADRAAPKVPRDTARFYIQAGRYLLTLKERVGYGKWTAYLHGYDISQKTAERYMLIANNAAAVLAVQKKDRKPISFRRAIQAAYGEVK